MEVTYLTWTEDNLLRQISYQGQREDKPARQVARSIPYPRRQAGKLKRLAWVLNRYRPAVRHCLRPGRGADDFGKIISFRKEAPPGDQTPQEDRRHQKSAPRPRPRRHPRRLTGRRWNGN